MKNVKKKNAEQSQAMKKEIDIFATIAFFIESMYYYDVGCIVYVHKNKLKLFIYSQ